MEYTLSHSSSQVKKRGRRNSVFEDDQARRYHAIELNLSGSYHSVRLMLNQKSADLCVVSKPIVRSNRSIQDEQLKKEDRNHYFEVKFERHIYHNHDQSLANMRNVTKLIPGFPVCTAISQHFQLQSQKLSILLASMKALKAMHDKHCYHMDCYYNNILYNPETETAELIDFETSIDTEKTDDHRETVYQIADEAIYKILQNEAKLSPDDVIKKLAKHNERNKNIIRVPRENFYHTDEKKEVTSGYLDKKDHFSLAVHTLDINTYLKERRQPFLTPKLEAFYLHVFKAAHPKERASIEEGIKLIEEELDNVIAEEKIEVGKKLENHPCKVKQEKLLNNSNFRKIVMNTPLIENEALKFLRGSSKNLRAIATLNQWMIESDISRGNTLNTIKKTINKNKYLLNAVKILFNLEFSPTSNKNVTTSLLDHPKLCKLIIDLNKKGWLKHAIQNKIFHFIYALWSIGSAATLQEAIEALNTAYISPESIPELSETKRQKLIATLLIISYSKDKHLDRLNDVINYFKKLELSPEDWNKLSVNISHLNKTVVTCLLDYITQHPKASTIPFQVALSYITKEYSSEFTYFINYFPNDAAALIKTIEDQLTKPTSRTSTIKKITAPNWACFTQYRLDIISAIENKNTSSTIDTLLCDLAIEHLNGKTSDFENIVEFTQIFRFVDPSMFDTFSKKLKEEKPEGKIKKNLLLYNWSNLRLYAIPPGDKKALFEKIIFTVIDAPTLDGIESSIKEIADSVENPIREVIPPELITCFDKPTLDKKNFSAFVQCLNDHYASHTDQISSIFKTQENKPGLYHIISLLNWEKAQSVHPDSINAIFSAITNNALLSALAQHFLEIPSLNQHIFTKIALLISTLNAETIDFINSQFKKEKNQKEFLILLTRLEGTSFYEAKEEGIRHCFVAWINNPLLSNLVDYHNTNPELYNDNLTNFAFLLTHIHPTNIDSVNEAFKRSEQRGPILDVISRYNWRCLPPNELETAHRYIIKLINNSSSNEQSTPAEINNVTSSQSSSPAPSTDHSGSLRATNAAHTNSSSSNGNEFQTPLCTFSDSGQPPSTTSADTPIRSATRSNTDNASDSAPYNNTLDTPTRSATRSNTDNASDSAPYNNTLDTPTKRLTLFDIATALRRAQTLKPNKDRHEIRIDALKNITDDSLPSEVKPHSRTAAARTLTQKYQEAANPDDAFCNLVKGIYLEGFKRSGAGALSRCTETRIRRKRKLEARINGNDCTLFNTRENLENHAKKHKGRLSNIINVLTKKTS